jgi:hypothetical protein
MIGGSSTREAECTVAYRNKAKKILPHTTGYSILWPKFQTTQVYTFSLGLTKQATPTCHEQEGTQ